jgi:pimeloyl-ACP methyl ester carboxylesterase
MGLGAYRTAWKRQTRYFGHHHSSAYSSLVFDNRGMGLSSKPATRYSTTEMARDTIDLLIHLNWLSSSLQPTGSTLNLIGVSMGGMIAQELALLLPPGSINTLILCSTAPRLIRTVPFIENVRQRINMFIPRDLDVQLDEISLRLFSQRFLDKPDTEADEPYTGGPEGGNFPTNRDRYRAGEMDKRLDQQGFTRKGFMLQAIAAGWHHKSAAQMKDLAERVGRSRVAVCHGTGDRMITYQHAELLKQELGEGIEWKVWEGSGHVLMWEEEEEWNAWVERFVKRARAMS